MKQISTAHILVHGRVQGVGFRAWVQHQAELHGLSGWVRNRRDGAVEALFAGPEDAVAVILKACRQGPSGSLVENVEMLPDPEAPPRAGFEVRGTV
ncbi:MAG TPA: acylphosphatase [Microvirga sp.]|jgi:acylphosphatase